MKCSQCTTSLVPLTLGEIKALRCNNPRCASILLTRTSWHALVGNAFAAQVRDLARAKRGIRKRLCANCKKPMTHLVFDTGKTLKFDPDTPLLLKIDYCITCEMAGFSRDQINAVRAEFAPAQKDRRAPLEQRKESLFEAYSSEQTIDALLLKPEMLLAALFGLPLKADEVKDANKVRKDASVLWIFAAGIATFSISAFMQESLYKQFAYYPLHPFRIFGVTLFSAALLHGNVMHLVSNLYFYFLVGIDVIEEIGGQDFLFLFWLGHLLGTVLHTFFETRPQLHLVGASAGISAMMTYFSLAFPKKRIRMFLGARQDGTAWASIPAAFALVLWIAFQFFLANRQLNGLSNVSALGHLGGAAWGLIFFLMTQKPKPSPP